MILGLIPKKTLIVIGVIVAVIVIYVLNQKGQADAQGSPTGCKVTVTADVLNARETPDGNGKIVGKYLNGAEFDAMPVQQNGFREVAKDKWVASSFVKPLEGSKC
ncbi:SH3 domain-containing protein [Amycolatopsis carbonis]|uniref:SH3 domain-containing protein n=1 Tax=Amycolatopsis carbonis TaxID=715471 RepID=A0A9Y2II51_9PSEU|nr:SH3 domain-containing protein [Amycolatopsis sp. 2-15]WIX79864.1 SH3 domain-containing protein [Amycolatopsis sp. 2-15]